MQIVINGIIGALVYLYQLTGSLGWSIIGFTILVRLVLVPLTLPSLKAQKQLRQVKPELDQLKHKHKNDKKALQQAQVELYKKYNINPLNGCLPQLVQIGLLILLYHSLNTFIRQPIINGVTIDSHFFWLDLAKPDPLFIIPVLAAATQLALSLMIAPATEVRDVVPNASKKKAIKAANEKEQDMAEMAETMQQQMLFIMPLMTGVIALGFPAGLGLYWVITTVASVIQQYLTSGPGGLTLYVERALALIKAKTSRV